ncbi:MAG TPA: hypothetical protein VFH51_15900, partial [Myxococcota bacterium]|nr:hypothetical protein [Myxococcota bacterium]
RGNPTGNMTLRDARAAFATAGDRAGDSRATDRAMGHHGVPARYQKTDYERLAAVSLAVETWLLTHAAELVERPPARRLTLDMTTRLWSVDS